jgi:hypothetical protein
MTSAPAAKCSNPSPSRNPGVAANQPPLAPAFSLLSLVSSPSAAPPRPPSAAPLPPVSTTAPAAHLHHSPPSARATGGGGCTAASRAHPHEQTHGWGAGEATHMSRHTDGEQGSPPTRAGAGFVDSPQDLRARRAGHGGGARGGLTGLAAGTEGEGARGSTPRFRPRSRGSAGPPDGATDGGDPDPPDAAIAPGRRRRTPLLRLAPSPASPPPLVPRRTAPLRTARRGLLLPRRPSSLASDCTREPNYR